MNNESTKTQRTSGRGILGMSIVLILIVAAVFAFAVLLAYYCGQYWQRPLFGLSILICPIIAIVFAWRSKESGWIKAALGVCIAFLGPMGFLLIYSMVMPIVFFAIQSCSFLHETPAEFWKWFSDNSYILSDSLPILNPYYVDLEHHIHRVDPHLHCTIGDAQSDGSRTLTISPDNDRRAYPIAERVVAEAPKFKNWHVVACDQRQPLSDRISVGYATWVRTQNILFVIKDRDRKVDIELYLNSDEPRLDEEESRDLPARVIRASLGERDYMFLIDTIDVFSGDTKIPSMARPISALPAEFDSWAGNAKRDFRSTSGGPDIIPH